LAEGFDDNKNPPAEPVRYSIDVATGDVTCTRLVIGYDLDWPVFPPHLVTRPSKFTYFSGNLAGQRSGGVKCAPAVGVHELTPCIRHALVVLDFMH
jgi:hypothetical protein